MGGDRELTEAVQMGNIDTTAVSSSLVAAFNKNYFALDMPFMFKDRLEAYAALDGKLGKLLLDSLDKNNLKGLGFFENGFRVLTNGVREVKVLDDLKGMKLRTMQNSVHLAMWKAEGANPTPMSYNEVFTALQQRTIDGQENPTPQIWNAKFFEVQKFLTVTNHSYTPYVLFMNKDFYNKLSEEDKKLIASASRQMTEFNRKLATEQTDECMENIRKAGLKITTLTDEELGKFREKAMTMLPMIEKDLNKDVLAAFHEVVKKK
jgi:tripartite ATP-independent transporter DctP family solute receptor